MCGARGGGDGPPASSAEGKARVDAGKKQRLATAQEDIMRFVLDASKLMRDDLQAGVHQGSATEASGTVSFKDTIPPQYFTQVIFSDKDKRIELIVWSAELAKGKVCSCLLQVLHSKLSTRFVCPCRRTSLA